MAGATSSSTSPTITIGLLIALSLEAMVESLHHRAIVREARENIRREIEHNITLVKEDIASVQSDADRMRQNMETARDLRSNSHALNHPTMHFAFSWSSFDDSAWLSARDSGALTYMPTSEVQNYADAYKQQSFINQQAVAVFAYQTELIAPLIMEKDPTAMPPADAHDLIKGCAVASIRLTLLKQLMEQLGKEYEDVLHK